MDVRTLGTIERKSNFKENEDALRSHCTRAVLPVITSKGQVVRAYTYGSAQVREGLARIQSGAAHCVSHYPLELAGGDAFKLCCRDNPDHHGPHFN